MLWIHHPKIYNIFCTICRYVLNGPILLCLDFLFPSSLLPKSTSTAMVKFGILVGNTYSGPHTHLFRKSPWSTPKRFGKLVDIANTESNEVTVGKWMISTSYCGTPIYRATSCKCSVASASNNHFWKQSNDVARAFHLYRGGVMFHSMTCVYLISTSMCVYVCFLSSQWLRSMKPFFRPAQCQRQKYR